MFSVSVPAATTGLTTLAAVKTALGINIGSEDSYLNSQISAVSAMVCTFLGVSVASDGGKTLGRETIVETVRKSDPYCKSLIEGPTNRQIVLARYPVVSITSIVEDGTTLETTDYEVDGSNGLLKRLNEDNQVNWYAEKVVITYVAGWLLPGDAGANLPKDIESAAIDLIKATRAARMRDPLAKRIEIPDVRTVDYWVGGTAKNGSGMSSDIEAKLAPYRNMVV